jgi:hypothetical protein
MDSRCCLRQARGLAAASAKRSSSSLTPDRFFKRAQSKVERGHYKLDVDLSEGKEPGEG